MPKHDGSIIFGVQMDDKDAQKALDNLHKDIAETEKAINKTTKEIDKAQSAVNKADTSHNSIVEQMEAARQAAKEANKEIEALNAQKAENEKVLTGREGEIGLEEFEARKQAQAEIEYSLKEQEKIVAESEKKLDKLAEKEQAANQTLQEKTAELEKQKALLEQQTLQLSNQQESAGAIERDLSEQANSALPRIKAAAESMNGSFKGALKNILKWGFGIRSLFILFRRLKAFVKDAVLAFAEQDETTKNTINSLKANLAALKNAWGAAFAPIFAAVAPAINYLVGLLTRAGNAIAMFMAILSGKTTYKKAIANTDALTESLEGAGGAAQEAKKQLSGLDEMNLWQEDSGGGGGGSNPLDSYVEETINPDSGVGKIAEFLRENLESAELLIDEYAFVLGMVLAFSGASIPLGLGLMVYGGFKVVKDIKENWGAISQQLQGPMGEIMALLNGAFLALGVILLLTGASIPLGLGLMVVGAAGLAATVAANWNGVSEQVKSTIGTITTVLGGALLAIGFLLVMSMNPATVALGIGLLAAGAASLAAGVALNWKSMEDKIGAVTKTLVEIVSGALIAVGALLAFTGVNIPLGIALIAAGAVGIVATQAVNWNAISEKLQGPIGKAVALVSGASLVLGILLLIAGNIPLGLGLIAAGAAGLVATAAANWDNLKKVGATALEKVKEGWEAAKEKGKELLITVGVTVEKVGKWAGDAVEALKEKGGTVLKTVQEKLQQANSWSQDMRRALQQKKETVLKTVQEKVAQANSWSQDMRLALQQKKETVLKTVQEKLQQANSWSQDMRAALKAKAETIKRTVQQGLEKATGNKWSQEAYNVISSAAEKTISAIAKFTGLETNADGSAAGIGNVWSYAKAWFNDWQNSGISPWSYAEAFFNSWSTLFDEKPQIDCEASFSTWHTDGDSSGRSGSFAKGGAFYGGAWHNIPQYAKGTLRAGSFFIAGEAGPEVVGHVGGRTEVLNQSQLAATMYSAVRSAIAGIKFNIVGLPTGYPSPLMASGSVTPPNVMVQFGGNYDLDDVVTRLDALLMRQERPIEVNADFRAEVNGRTLFREVLREGRSQQTASGRNPFDL